MKPSECEFFESCPFAKLNKKLEIIKKIYVDQHDTLESQQKQIDRLEHELKDKEEK